jgi:hypothetical protein
MPYLYTRYLILQSTQLICHTNAILQSLLFSYLFHSQRNIPPFLEFCKWVMNLFLCPTISMSSHSITGKTQWLYCTNYFNILNNPWYLLWFCMYALCLICDLNIQNCCCCFWWRECVLYISYWMFFLFAQCTRWSL